MALVDREGSVDWLCWPRFDSPSVFGALLDEAGGRWRIGPVGPARVERRYVPGTAVLETRFHGPQGTLRVTDLLPAGDPGEMQPEHELLRLVACESGEATLELALAPRPGYGAERPCPRPGPHGIRLASRSGLLLLRTDLPVGIEGDAVVARTTLRAGEERQASLTLAREGPAVVPGLGRRGRDAVARTVAWWQRWAAAVAADLPERAAVLQSAVVLKLLVFAPSGAIVAAPTTSLPERLGGDLNWDYRFCWLRDAALVVRAFVGLGLVREAEAFVSWLLHATRLTQPRLQVLHDVYGRQPAAERVLAGWRGHGGARPVRIGNGASGQVQLDVYGEVVDAAGRLARHTGTLDREAAGLLVGLGEYVCGHWDAPDHGIWEPRSAPQDHTHSRLLCWVALDRLLDLHGAGLLPRAPAARFAAQREAIARQLRERAWNDHLGSYVSVLDGDDVDASLLLLGWHGFEDPGSERMRRTRALVRERLGAAGGTLYRYRDGTSPGEGAFGACAFWDADLLARGAGSAEEAADLLGRLCGLANDVGLFGEEVDPETGEPLGNFPQAFTHVGLVNAALSLRDRREGRR